MREGGGEEEEGREGGWRGGGGGEGGWRGGGGREWLSEESGTIISKHETSSKILTINYYYY